MCNNKNPFLTNAVDYQTDDQPARVDCLDVMERMCEMHDIIISSQVQTES